MRACHRFSCMRLYLCVCFCTPSATAVVRRCICFSVPWDMAWLRVVPGGLISLYVHWQCTDMEESHVRYVSSCCLVMLPSSEVTKHWFWLRHALKDLREQTTREHNHLLEWTSHRFHYWVGSVSQYSLVRNMDNSGFFGRWPGKQH